MVVVLEMAGNEVDRDGAVVGCSRSSFRELRGSESTADANVAARQPAAGASGATLSSQELRGARGRRTLTPWPHHRDAVATVARRRRCALCSPWAGDAHATLSLVMAIVDSTSRREDRRRRPRIRGPASPDAARAHDAVYRLQRYFVTRAELQEALGWSAPTLRQWLADEPPARPRAQNVQSAVQLLDVAVAAGRWVADPKTVGKWLLDPNPDLRGAVPAEIAVELPRESVELFIADMALVAPREQALPTPTKLTPDTLRQALAELSLPAITPRRTRSKADLSDFD